MRIHSFVLLLVATAAFAVKPASDTPVGSTLADYDATNTPYYVQSDAGGAHTATA